MLNLPYREACTGQDVNSLKRIYQVDGDDVVRRKACGYIYVNNPAWTKVSLQVFDNPATLETHEQYKDTVMTVAE